MFSVFRKNAEILNKTFVGTEQVILIEGVSKLISKKNNLVYLYHSLFNIYVFLCNEILMK